VRLCDKASGYDITSRLATVGDGTNAAVYTYLANSALVGNIGFQHNGQTVMTTTKSYDYLNRLTAISSAAGSSPMASFNYNYNLANQRTASTNVDNSYWVYQYDSLGQVVSGKKYWANGTPVAGQQFTYNFDDIGNRQSTASGGDATGSNLRTANYAANNLNEYTSRGIPSYSEISGSANANATVTVNLQRAIRQGDYFWDELAVSNTTSPLWLALTNLAVLNNGTNADIIGTNQGNVFVKQTPEVFNYDADGNLTNDGRWAYTWDGENRLVKMTANTLVGPQFQLNFVYDAQSRRIQKIVATNGVALSTNNFVYDGWNLAAELNPNGTLVRSYIWGSDLSGSAQGAGGVGGLIAVSYHGTATTNCFAAFDGNGNIAALVNAADGTVSANYEYAPFGEVVRSTGPLARNNPIRFSTKYQDDESDLVYYGYRYYNASTGRWPNRDPLGEKGGLNLYGFVGNNSINKFDPFGLTTPVDVLDAFFGNSSEGLWIMEQNNDYTKRMQQWGAVQQALDKAKADLSANCSTWESNHKTSPNWEPTLTSSFSPDKASYRVPVPSPAGTGPGDAIKDYLIYKTTRHIDDNLWYSTVGSFTLCVTVDKVDCCAKKAKLKIWIYNPMTKQSFGVGNNLYPFGDKENQYMWWNWTEDYNFGSTGGGPTKGGGGWW